SQLAADYAHPSQPDAVGTGIGSACPVRLSERLLPIAEISHPRNDFPLLVGGRAERIKDLIGISRAIAMSLAASRSGVSRTVRGISPEVRNAALVFLVALVAALLRVSPVVVIATAMLGLLLAAWALRRRGAEAAGPMFFYDLLRLSRRGRSTLLRCSYAVFLLAGLYLVYWNRFPVEAEFGNLFRLRPRVRLDELARFAGTFATSIFALQSAAVMVLTPAYVAGAIAEERERRTLELLFTTHLTDREIVLGKLFG